jgi:hypothetical protein
VLEDMMPRCCCLFGYCSCTAAHSCCLQRTSWLLVGHGPKSQSCHGLTPAQHNDLQQLALTMTHNYRVTRSSLAAFSTCIQTQLAQASNQSAAAALSLLMSELLVEPRPQSCQRPATRENCAFKGSCSSFGATAAAVTKLYSRLLST